MKRIIFKHYAHKESSNPYDYVVVMTETKTFERTRFAGIYGGAIEVKRKKDLDALVIDLKDNGYKEVE